MGRRALTPKTESDGLPEFAGKGVPVTVNLGTRRKPVVFRFITGEPGRMVVPGTGDNAVQSGEIRLPGGKLVYGLLYFDEASANELCFVQFVMPRKVVNADALQQPPWDVPKRLLFPFKYRYYVPVARDLHIGKDGWST